MEIEDEESRACSSVAIKGDDFVILVLGGDEARILRAFSQRVRGEKEERRVGVHDVKRSRKY